MEHTISIKSQAERKVTDTKSLPFGKIPTEHMFIAEYKNGEWHNAQVVPFHDLTLSPLALCLHYGQTVFEGMKAFVMEDGHINIFRMEKHYERFIKSLSRMCMPAVPQKLFTNAIHQLVQLDGDWVPREADGSLYIRPFMIATEDRIGVKVSEEYLFMVVCSPAFQYYAKPLKVKVETNFENLVSTSVSGVLLRRRRVPFSGPIPVNPFAKSESLNTSCWTCCCCCRFAAASCNCC